MKTMRTSSLGWLHVTGRLGIGSMLALIAGTACGGKQVEEEPLTPALETMINSTMGRAVMSVRDLGPYQLRGAEETPPMPTAVPTGTTDDYSTDGAEVALSVIDVDAQREYEVVFDRAALSASAAALEVDNPAIRDAFQP